jgi:hypothetical protein
MDPRPNGRPATLFEKSWEAISSIINELLGTQKDLETGEIAVVAKGLSKAANLLCTDFNLILTNVPFLTQIKFSSELDNFLDQKFKPYRANLATAMVARVNELLSAGGVFGFVAPQSWWFLKRYQQLREDYIQKYRINCLARLGEKAFESAQANGEQVGLSLCSKTLPSQESQISLIDVSNESSRDDKAGGLIRKRIDQIFQVKQLDNDSSALLFEKTSGLPSLASFCTAFFGSSAGDRPRFVKCFWEVDSTNHRVWEYLQSSPSVANHFSGLEECIFWEKESGQMFKLAESVKNLNHKAQQWRSGKANWGKQGLVSSLMSPFPTGIYTGNIYDTNCCAIIPNDQSKLLPLIAFGISKEFFSSIKSLNQNRKVEVKNILSARFDFEKWRLKAERYFPHGLPAPYSDSPDQSIFHGYPCGSVIWDEEIKWTVRGSLRLDDSVLQVAVARLLGYRWPGELDDEMELAKEQRAWVQRCEDLNGHVDDDGIVCLPAVRGEKSADQRLEALLQDAYGQEWTIPLKNRLLETVGSKSLNIWLRDKFFEQHFKLFHHRPFIWHIWDGLKDGFSVLVNYHKLDKAGLERLIYTYLGDWIRTQQTGVADGEDGADVRLAAAQTLKKELEAILEGDAPYDIFVRWKPWEEQPFGWNPDLNDGVRLNIRPFMKAKDLGKKGAGILRAKPNIHWNKDRGKDVPSAPPSGRIVGTT